MFSHVVVGSNDLEVSKSFYDALFEVLGASSLPSDTGKRLIYQKDQMLFLVTQPIDGEKATCANGGTVGFALSSPDQVVKWQEAGIAHGGTAIEDPAGIRVVMGMRLFLAYLRDPDGNKLCAFHKMAD